jgi:uncharacterized protein YbaA (DUF1428 family)
MTYIDGFVAAVPQENRQAYLAHARDALSLFNDYGATRMVENWGDDVPVGKVTDFHRSVHAVRSRSPKPSTALSSYLPFRSRRD